MWPYLIILLGDALVRRLQEGEDTAREEAINKLKSKIRSKRIDLDRLNEELNNLPSSLNFPNFEKEIAAAKQRQRFNIDKAEIQLAEVEDDLSTAEDRAYEKRNRGLFGVVADVIKADPGQKTFNQKVTSVEQGLSKINLNKQ